MVLALESKLVSPLPRQWSCKTQHDGNVQERPSGRQKKFGINLAVIAEAKMLVWDFVILILTKGIHFEIILHIPLDWLSTAHQIFPDYKSNKST